jgi:predicted DCC family thiol-disulfide oxidoreductase YuxK
MATAPLLLYDGSCGFCESSVQWVLRRDGDGALRFAALQGPTGLAIRDRHPTLIHADSVVWVDDPGGPGEAVRIKADAVAAILRYLGGVWRLLTVFWIVPRPVRDGVYDLVARHRHRVPLGVDTCLLPTPEQRARFLD